MYDEQHTKDILDHKPGCIQVQKNKAQLG